jgi:hypothetical protein
MSKKTINIGIDPDDGTGDPLRTSMDKINSNFTEFYDAITPTGKNVGIGTATPSARLNVVSDTSYEAVKITQTGSGNALVVQDIDNDTSPFVVTSTGSVGIGKTTPIYPLDVNGDIKTSSKLRFSSDNRYLSYENSSYVLPNANLYINNSLAITVSNFNNYAPTLTGTGAYGFWENVSVNTSIYSEGSFTNTFTIGTSAYHVANGNLGIGIPTPQVKLHVVNDLTAIEGVSDTQYGISGVSNTSVAVRAYSNTGSGIYTISEEGYGIKVQSNIGVVAQFQNNESTFATIFANGNMSIGHDFIIPEARLHVFTDDAGNTSIIGYSEMGIGVYGASNSAAAGVYGSSLANNGVYAYSNTGTALFVVSNTGKVTQFSNSTVDFVGIFANGNMSVGHDFISPTSRLHVFTTGGVMAIQGESFSNSGVSGYANTGVGVEAISFSNTGMGAFSNTGYGISGTSISNTGIGAYSNTGMGIQGTSISNTGGAFYSNTGVGLQVYSNSGIVAQFSNNAYNVLFIGANGNIGIGSNSNPTHKLSVNGTTYFGSNVTITNPVVANGSPGSSGQVLTSNGSTGSTYWSTVTPASPVVTVGAVGSYALMKFQPDPGLFTAGSGGYYDLAPGFQVAGSTLQYSSISAHALELTEMMISYVYFNPNYSYYYASGTWQLAGQLNYSYSSGPTVALFQRIS